MKVLLADSGGTKTDWVLIDSKSVIKEWESVGLNPNSVSKDLIVNVLGQCAKEFNDVGAIEFYGAGCSTSENQKRLKEIIQEAFPETEVSVRSDIVAVAKALLGHGTGIVGILGTGSNSALFEKGRFVCSRPSYGYLLGDEGSGACLGRILLKGFLEEDLSPSLQLKLKAKINLSEEDLIKKLYGPKARPTELFSSVVPYYNEYKKDYPELIQLLKSAFFDYFKRFIAIYHGKNNTKDVYLIGSIAYHFKSEIKSVLEENGYTLNLVIQKPMGRLVEYHQAKL